MIEKISDFLFSTVVFVIVPLLFILGAGMILVLGGYIILRVLNGGMCGG